MSSQDNKYIPGPKGTFNHLDLKLNLVQEAQSKHGAPLSTFGNQALERYVNAQNMLTDTRTPYATFTGDAPHIIATIQWARYVTDFGSSLAEDRLGHILHERDFYGPSPRHPGTAEPRPVRWDIGVAPRDLPEEEDYIDPDTGLVELDDEGLPLRWTPLRDSGDPVDQARWDSLFRMHSDYRKEGLRADESLKTRVEAYDARIRIGNEDCKRGFALLRKTNGGSSLAILNNLQKVANNQQYNGNYFLIIQEFFKTGAARWGRVDCSSISDLRQVLITATDAWCGSTTLRITVWMENYAVLEGFEQQKMDGSVLISRDELCQTFRSGTTNKAMILAHIQPWEKGLRSLDPLVKAAADAQTWKQVADEMMETVRAHPEMDVDPSWPAQAPIATGGIQANSMTADTNFAIPGNCFICDHEHKKADCMANVNCRNCGKYLNSQALREAHSGDYGCPVRKAAKVAKGVIFQRDQPGGGRGGKRGGSGRSGGRDGRGRGRSNNGGKGKGVQQQILSALQVLVAANSSQQPPAKKAKHDEE